MSEPNSPKQSSSSQGSAREDFIRIVEQLIDSDDDQTIMKRMAELQPIFPILKKMNGNISNQQKINLFLKDGNFRTRLTDKLRQSNQLFYSPVVKISIYTIRHCLPVTQEFEQEDIRSICQKYGALLFVGISKNTAYIKYDNYISCYLMIKSLNGFEINDNLRLAIAWCTQQDFIMMQQLFTAVINDKQIKKCMGRYDILIETNNQFKISKRIIGPSGNNLKKILNDVIIVKCKLENVKLDSIAKIRLRGKGSGFLEGQPKIQSDEILNLCISSINSIVFELICEQIQKLLLKISLDYKDYYYKTHKKSCQGIAYRRYEIKKNQFQFVKQMNLQQINSVLDFISPAPNKKEKLTQNEIIQLINQRHKARKQGRFKQADKIRDELKRSGVLLFDQKHGNSHMCKTTWKYLDQ